MIRKTTGNTLTIDQKIIGVGFSCLFHLCFYRKLICGTNFTSHYQYCAENCPTGHHPNVFQQDEKDLTENLRAQHTPQQGPVNHRLAPLGHSFGLTFRSNGAIINKMDTISEKRGPCVDPGHALMLFFFMYRRCAVCPS